MVFPMKWGFTIPGIRPVFNARVESAAQRQSFREAWEQHRCIVPASGYIEWEHLTGEDGRKKTGARYLIRSRDSDLVFMCGLYRIEDGLPAFVILTREPGEDTRFIHDRMPLMLPEERVGAWIDPGAKPEELLTDAVTAMRCLRGVETT